MLAGPMGIRNTKRKRPIIMFINMLLAYLAGADLIEAAALQLGQIYAIKGLSLSEY